MNFHITPMEPRDWASVREIYREGIASGNATFETEPPHWERWDSAHRKDCRLLVRDGLAILAWAALSPVSTRSVYAGVAEVSIYVAPAMQGRGIGTALLPALVEQSEAHGVWTLQAGIFPENLPSIALHKACGFREVGLRQRLGKLGNVWRDVLLLERRSASAGI